MVSWNTSATATVIPMGLRLWGSQVCMRHGWLQEPFSSRNGSTTQVSANFLFSLAPFETRLPSFYETDPKKNIPGSLVQSKNCGIDQS